MGGALQMWEAGRAGTFPQPSPKSPMRGTCSRTEYISFNKLYASIFYGYIYFLHKWSQMKIKISLSEQ